MRLVVVEADEPVERPVAPGEDYAGEIDVAQDVPYNQIDKLMAMPNLQIQLNTYYRIDWIQFNEKVDKFQDVKVRQAVAMAGHPGAQASASQIESGRPNAR